MLALLKIYWLTVQVTFLSFGGINSFWALLERETVHECSAGAAPAAGGFTVCRDDFNTAFVLSKILPGPHVGPVSILGYRDHGLAGMLAVLLGLLTPGLLISPLLYLFYKRSGASPVLKAFFRGAGIASLAILVVFLLVIFAAQIHGDAAHVLASSLLFAVSFWLSYRYRLNPLIAVLCAGVLGFVFMQ